CGLFALASSYGQGGGRARDVKDAALAFAAMAGEDGDDATSLRTPVPDVLRDLERSAGGVRIGLLAEASAEGGGLHRDVAAALEASAEALRAAGASVSPVSVPRTPFAVAIYYLTATAEA